MGMFEILGLLSSKDGDELFEKLVNILARFDIEVTDEEGNDKSFYTLCCDVVNVWNKGK